MKIDVINIEGNSVAEVVSDGIEIRNTDDVLDIMGNCSYQGAGSIVIQERNIIPEFFDLKMGIAGEILQKFSTYGMRLAVVGDFSKYTSKSLRDFIYESNRVGRINFVSSTEEARTALAKR
ncbi:MAG TPA: DUF4180 domain-containing protein [Williamwhitmania sp.]|nr:DUF4180 domain-containing protein [Williamwhitmania sp.]